MRPKEITVWISPADLAPWNGAEVPIRFVWTETTILVELGPSFEKQSFMERLRMKFAKIESQVSGQSLEIMRLILATPSGELSRKALLKHIWGDYPVSTGRVLNAISVLNDLLERLEFGYEIKSYRKKTLRIEVR